MNVYAYFDTCYVSDVARHTLAMWKDSWESNGWHPVVLTENEAANHPLYEVFKTKISSFPTVNVAKFDYQAFMRWLAVASLADDFVVTTEPDVINYTLTPDALRQSKVLEIHSPVPAFIVGAPELFERCCARIIQHTVQAQDEFMGRPHLSDQDFASRYLEPEQLVKFVRESPLCSEAFHSEWETSPCVHYGTPYMLERGIMPKHEHIPALRPATWLR